MVRCGECNVFACYTGELDKAPKFCPMRNMKDVIENAVYEGEKRRIAEVAAEIEAEGYLRWCRVEETVKFAKRCGFKKIGIAFCIGLRKEVKILIDVLKKHGFDVYSVVCKTGSIPKEKMGFKKIREEKQEVMCNPIAQAMILNSVGTDLNIIFGLCVGHDSLFIMHSNAPVTCLVAKDRVLAHNPIGAIYSSHHYYKRIFEC